MTTKKTPRSDMKTAKNTAAKPRKRKSEEGNILYVRVDPALKARMQARLEQERAADPAGTHNLSTLARTVLYGAFPA